MVIPFPGDRDRADVSSHSNSGTGTGTFDRNMPVFSARPSASPNRSPPSDRTMPIFSSQSQASSPLLNRSMSTQMQGRPGSLGDNRYSPTSAMRSNAFTSPPSSAGRGGMGSATPMLPRGILRNTANGTRSGRLSRGGLSPATHYSPPTSISDAQTLTESIERAARITESVYSKDSQYPSLFQALVGNDQLGGLRAVSGTVEQDYPGVIERGLLSKRLFTVEHQTPIPTELREMLLRTDKETEAGVCQMGLFPEISRAWMTIGTDLYLWDFRDGSDLSFYDGLSEPILTLALIPAKPNVFRPNLRHVLCVTTLSQIVLLGFIIVQDESSLGIATPVRTTMEVIAQPIYTLSSDGVTFTVVAGASNGRIFIGGADGYIYEVFYQAHRGWIRDKCWKTNMTKSIISKYLPKFLSLSTTDRVKEIVIDNQRHILFSLSMGGTISAYDLGSNGTEFNHLSSISQDSIINGVLVASRKSLEPSTVTKILSIAPIEYGELSLVAMSDAGTRIYFSCYSRPQFGISPTARPSVLQLAHIRLPPGCSPMSTMRKPSGTTAAYYSNGIFTISTPASRDSSAIWLISPFIYPTPNYAELSTIHMVPGLTVDIRELSIGDPSIDFQLPEVMTQHMPYRREIVVLTNQGTTVLKAAKPYELLRDLLIERQGPENMKGHFEMLPNRVQPLANCVLLAIHPFNFADNIVDLATKTIYWYGGGGTTETTTVGSTMKPHVNFDLRHTSGFYEGSNNGQASPGVVGGNTFMSPSSPLGPPTLSSTFREPSPQSPAGGGIQQNGEPWPYSPRHDAIYTTVARILASFWNIKLLRMGTVEGTKVNVIMPNVTGEHVSYAIHFLQNVHNFILNNPSLYLVRSKVDINLKQETTNTPEGLRLLTFDNEKSSMCCLKNLLGHALEVLGMWKVLCDHQINIILQGVDERFLNSTMRDLIVAGQESIPIIINSLISKYLGDNAAVDAISMRLREVCPTLFRNEDAIGSKVAEILQKARQTTNEGEKETMLRDSLILCEKICGLGRVNIRNFCMQFAELGFPLGAIKLCESAASAVDPNYLARGALKLSNVDPASAQAHSNRCEIYKIVFEILDLYFNSSSRQMAMTGRSSDENLPSERARFYADDTFHGILASEDEVFHVMLYNWLLERALFERLLEIRHPFLDGFLQRAAETAISGKWPRSGGIGDKRILDLLWRHHEMNGDHVAAAQILNRLADSASSGLTLEDRLDYLARANICLKGAGRLGFGEDLESLEAKLEVAQIQKGILDVLENRLRNLSGTTTPAFDHTLSNELKKVQDGITRLNAQLFSNSEIYEEFAVPFKLHEFKVEIFCVAGHQSKNMIESFYADIVEAEMNAISREPMEAQAEIIRNKILAMGRKYFKSPTYFPVEYLVEHLEAMKPTELADQSWVVKIMLEVGVPFTELIKIYERLWNRTSERTNSAAGTDAQTQIARVIMNMVDSLLTRTVTVILSRYHMNELIEKCNGLLCKMIVEFSAKFEPEATVLKNQLASIKDRLQEESSP